jgi:hypothetical protein
LVEDEIRRQHRETREAIQATERRLRTCLLVSIGVAVLVILSAMLALTSLLMTHPH